LGRQYLIKNGFDIEKWTETQLNQIIQIDIQRIKKFADIGKEIDFLWQQPNYSPEILAYKAMNNDQTKASLEWSQRLLYNIEDMKVSEIEDFIKTAIQAKNKQMGEILWPLRVALSGREKSASPFEIIAILGRDESIRRMQYAINLLA
jgi:glutamyl/glutaminyl-tRNA synthetase